VLDEDAPALHVVLDVVRGALECRHAHPEVLRGDDDLARPEIEPGLGHGDVLDEAMVPRHRAVLEHELAVVHETAAQCLVAARDGEARGIARHEEARGPLGDARARLRRAYTT